LIRYTFADVIKMYLGIQQSQEGLRRAAFIIHCSLVKNAAKIEDIYPLPFDEDPSVRANARKQEYEKLREQTFTNGNGAATDKNRGRSIGGNTGS
jgi:hypothetical protein